MNSFFISHFPIRSSSLGHQASAYSNIFTSLSWWWLIILSLSLSLSNTTCNYLSHISHETTKRRQQDMRFPLQDILNKLSKFHTFSPSYSLSPRLFCHAVTPHELPEYQTQLFTGAFPLDSIHSSVRLCRSVGEGAPVFSSPRRLVLVSVATTTTSSICTASHRAVFYCRHSFVVGVEGGAK